jgi:Flp pilus assembly pilin Flp
MVATESQSRRCGTPGECEELSTRVAQQRLFYSEFHQASGCCTARFHRPSLFAKEVNSMLKYFIAAQTFANDLRSQEEGQTMAEYGVVLAVITLLIVGTLTALSGGINGALQAVTDVL